jgi:hypothetical protein
VLELSAKSGDNEWSWTREFTIDADDARKLNREDVMIDNRPNWWMIGSIALVILLIGVILYLLIQKKKAKEKVQEQ